MMNSTIQEIEQVIRNEYPAGYGQVFLGDAHEKELGVEKFKKQIGLEVPELFYEFYAWAVNVNFPKGDVSKETSLAYDDENFIPSLKSILNETKEWQEIQKANPRSEWKKGFLALGSWNSAYMLVMDTLGEVGPKGCILYFDFKGGDYYHIIASDFEMHLKIKLELLKNKLYFPPNLSNDEEGFEDFMEGEKREKIEEIVRSINADVYQAIEI